MSYFLFGSFNSVHDRELLEQVKLYTSEKNIYIWFDEEITFSKEIHGMLEEQKADGNIKFAITSENQPYNSSDVLFPFDKFSSDVLFEDESRNFYKQCCRDNINVLFDCLKLIHLLNSKLRYKLCYMICCYMKLCCIIRQFLHHRI